MKSTSSIFLVPLSPVFNRDAVPLFDSMDNEHSAFLQSSLYLNNIEVIEKVKDQYNSVFCISNCDEQNLPLELQSVTYNVRTFDTSNLNSMFKILNEKYFSKSTKNLIIFSGAIGFSANDIQKVFELLSVEDDALVIGKSANDMISFLGFTRFHEEILFNLEMNYDSFLSVICRHNYYVTVLERSLYIRNWNDFKQLYSELSKKESLSYCSQKMHEQFTHLFIEYKEMIK